MMATFSVFFRNPPVFPELTTAALMAASEAAKIAEDAAKVATESAQMAEPARAAAEE